jgi:hypothetical protein
MKTGVIKVIKRNKKVEAENTQDVAKPLKSDGNANEKVVNTLNNWIAERRENDCTVRVNFNNKLLEWKIS